MQRSSFRPSTALIAGLVVAAMLGACSSDGSTAQDTSGSTSTHLPPQVRTIIDDAGLGTARWTVLVEPVDGGPPVLAVDDGAVTPMASVTKMYSVGTWLDTFGPDHRIETPVHAIGTVTNGVLDGDLVLRAMGDLVMGGRNADSGTIGYGVPPQEAANAVPGARPAPGDPLAGLNSLARQVAGSGITSVDGQVLVDDRLFEPYTTDRPLEISPIVINDNLLAVVTTPTTAGQPAAVTTIPDTAAYTVVNDTQTVADGDETSLGVRIELDADGTPTDTLVVSGQIAADSDNRLNVYPVDDPARFARTLFIEALERSGVTVAADPLIANDATLLVPATDYTRTPPVGTIESPTASALATFIWKTSNNVGADSTVCLMAVDLGSTDCKDGFAPIRERLADLGIEPGDVWLFDGSGSGAASTTPQAILTWLQWLHSREWGGQQLTGMLPILGVDGSLALSETDSASTGRVQAKTGTWALLDASTSRLLIPTQALVGFMDAADGTVYAFTVFMNGASFERLDGIFDSSAAVAAVAAAIQQQL